jgi:putative membrane protein
MLLIPVSEYFHKKIGISSAPSWFVAWPMLMTISMIYEIFEWGLTLVLSPDMADSYNGQQGDMWDSQKDMAMALLGASVMLLSLYILPHFRKRLEKL